MAQTLLIGIVSFLLGVIATMRLTSKVTTGNLHIVIDRQSYDPPYIFLDLTEPAEVTAKKKKILLDIICTSK